MVFVRGCEKILLGFVHCYLTTQLLHHKAMPGSYLARYAISLLTSAELAKGSVDVLGRCRPSVYIVDVVG